MPSPKARSSIRALDTGEPHGRTSNRLVGGKTRDAACVNRRPRYDRHLVVTNWGSLFFDSEEFATTSEPPGGALNATQGSRLRLFELFLSWRGQSAECKRGRAEAKTQDTDPRPPTFRPGKAGERRSAAAADKEQACV